MNPIALEFGFVTIYWYSIILFIAFFIGGSLAVKEASKWKISEDFMINYFFNLIIFSLLGARLYYVVFNLDYYMVNPLNILKIWEGGLAIHGALLFGLIFTFFYTRKYRVKTSRLLDIMVVSLILGQAIGRWGNFFNGEAHGAITTLETLQSWHLPQFIIDGMFINGQYYIPTFLMESIWCLIGFFVLLIIRHNNYIKTGQTTCAYMVWYGIGRFFIESFRTDSLMINSIKMAQAVSIFMVLIGIVLFIRIGKGSVFANKYNDISNTNEDRF